MLLYKVMEVITRRVGTNAICVVIIYPLFIGFGLNKYLYKGAIFNSRLCYI